MGFFDDLFNSPFDFNGDGKVSLDEEWIAFNIMQECMKEDKSTSGSFFADDDYEDEDDDIDLFCSEEDDDTVLDTSWRDFCEDGSEYFIYPEDYDTEEDYIEALETAKEEAETDDDDDEDEDDDSFFDDDEDEDIFVFPAVTVEQSKYPNKRMQQAAERLSDIKTGVAYISDRKTIKDEIEKCEFIVSSDTVAAKYLTVYDGFIMGQAVKENFQIPVDVPDEDEESNVYFPTLFMNIAEEDVNLAVDIWVWCIKEFGPYKKYLEYDDNFYGSIVSSMDDYPEEFIDVAIKRLSNDNEFRKGLLIESPEIIYSSHRFVTRALELNLITEAQEIFKAISLNPLVKGKPMEEIIDYIISDCSDWHNLEMMELVKFNIMPIVENMDDKRIQRLFPRFMKQINEYIDCVEVSNEKYQFSRRYEWRNHCADGSQYNIDPLDYETEEEYNDAVHERKYAWRKWRRNNRFGIDVDLFETESEYINAEKIKIEERLKTREAEYEVTKKIPKELSAEDKKVYKFCAVVFNGMNKPYSYLTGDLDVKVGDKVVVSIGDSQQERVATVVSVSECMKCVAPYPVDKAKTIIKICED